MFAFKEIRPEKFFLITATCFGLLFVIFNPPYQVPDEPNHFLRTYQISEGTLVSTQFNKRVGGFLPVSIDSTARFFYPMIWSGTDYKMRQINWKTINNIDLNTESRRFFDFNNTALYSPICYLPQLVPVFIGVKLNARPITLFYIARLFSFLFWLIIVFLAIKITPVCKWLFCFLALTPMSLFINTSVSADVVTNSLSFFFIAFVLRLKFQEQPLHIRQKLMLLIMVLLLALVKLTYFPIVALLFIIPVNQFGGIKKYLVSVVSFLLLGSFILVVWYQLIEPLHLFYDEYNPDFRDRASLAKLANMHQQLEFIRSNPASFVNLLFHSVVITFQQYTSEFIGKFGWLSIPLPNWLILYLNFAIVFTAFLDGDKKLVFSLFSASVFFTLFMVLFLIVFVSQYLVWLPVGAGGVGIQGRYLIPLVPLLLIPLKTKFVRKEIVVPFVVLSVTVGLVVSFLILMRYYF